MFMFGRPGIRAAPRLFRPRSLRPGRPTAMKKKKALVLPAPRAAVYLNFRFRLNKKKSSGQRSSPHTFCLRSIGKFSQLVCEAVVFCFWIGLLPRPCPFVCSARHAGRDRTGAAIYTRARARVHKKKYFFAVPPNFERAC